MDSTFQNTLKNKKNILAYSMKELGEYFESIGEKKFRAKQVYEWLHVKLADDFSEMSNLSKNLREKLEEEFYLDKLHIERVYTSKIDGTQKFLFRLCDGNIIESVLMRYKHGNSVCISTQVGCRMGCKFCASTLDGLVRNLTSSEMLKEVYTIQRFLNERVSNIVLMGSGEPMDNFDHVVRFVKMITDENGLHISQRNITISTCGLTENMRKLADEKFQVGLALSLHAADDETRRELMPVANRYSIQEALEACQYYFEQTGRRITFEYSLVAGVNDNLKEAEKLANLVGHMNCHINLIPVNPIKERDYKRSSGKNINEFKTYLERRGINVTVRREMGSDIQGACGQLRKSFIQGEA